MGPEQAEDLGLMAMEVLHSSELEPHHQMQFSVIQQTLVRRESYPSAEV